MRWLVLDVAAAPIEDAGSFMEPVSAPSNWKDPEKISAYVAEKTAERQQSMALDIDLARVSCIGVYVPGLFLNGPETHTVHAQNGQTSDDDEAQLLAMVGGWMKDATIVTYNGFNYDLPLLMRRARYLGVGFPKLNLDRYRSPHCDLCSLLSDNNPQRRRSLSFYTRRLGWTDLIEKPLDGADEARVFETGEWDKLAASVRRDVTATYRLAQWAGVIN